MRHIEPLRGRISCHGSWSFRQTDQRGPGWQPRIRLRGKTDNGRDLFVVGVLKEGRIWCTGSARDAKFQQESIPKAKRMNRHPRPIDSLKETPANPSDEERMDFLMEHGVSESFLEVTKAALEDERPRPRTRPINVRFDDFTPARLKALAESRNVGY